MTPSRIALADELNALVDRDGVSVTETNDALVAYQLNGAFAARVVTLLKADGWTDVELSDKGGAIDAPSLSADDEGIRLLARKPGVPAGVEAILTKDGLIKALARRDLSSRVWVHGLKMPFETWSVRFAPWGDVEAFVPLESPKSLRGIVRVLSDGADFPDDVGRWLLRDQSAVIAGLGIEPWRRRCVEQIAKIFAQEIEPDGRLTFVGPPAQHFEPQAKSFIEDPDLRAMQSAAHWLVENAREAESRHILLAAEIARSAQRGGDASDIAALTHHAFKGARIAYNFVITGQSKDTLKALAELRKSVSDETLKLTDAARTLATAVAGAAVANITILVARLTLPRDASWIPEAAFAVAFASALYVMGTIASGWQFLGLQRSLRTEWRSRLYRFLGDEEYSNMVATPIARAESIFVTASWIGGAIAGLLLLAVLLLAR